MLALNNGLQLDSCLTTRISSLELTYILRNYLKVIHEPFDLFVVVVGFFFEIGSEEGSQYGVIANSLVVKVYLLCSDAADSR